MNTKQNDNLMDNQENKQMNKDAFNKDALLEKENLELEEEENLELDDANYDFDQNLEGKELDKEIRKFNANYKRSLKQTFLSTGALKEVDEDYLKKIRLKRNEILTTRKKIDSNMMELDKAFDAFKVIYYHDVNEDLISDTKDKALAQKTLSYRKSVRDTDVKIEKLEKEYKEASAKKEEELAAYKKSFSQTLMDLDRKKKGEIQKGKKAKAEEIASLNEMLSSTNDRIRINAINERLNTIKKESSEGSKEINIKYVGLRKEEDIKNINYLLDFEKQKALSDKTYQLENTELVYQKKKDELEYNITSKTYMLAAKRADNNLKRDLVIKKDGMLVNIYDSNSSLHEKLSASCVELLELQKNYNKNVLDIIVKDYIERTNLLLKKIKYVTNEFEKENAAFLEKATPAFLQSLCIMNQLSLKNLNRIVKREIEETALYAKSAFDSALRSNTSYAEVNSKLEKIFANYKKETTDLVTEIYNLLSKEAKEILTQSTLDTYLIQVAKKRSENYKELMDEINHTITSFATSQNKINQEYQNEIEKKNDLIKEKAKYFVGDYVDAKEELEAIDKIYQENEIQIDEELNNLNSDIDTRRSNLENELTLKKNEIEANYKQRIDELEEKNEEDLKKIEEAFKEQMKTITGVYKTENKLL